MTEIEQAAADMRAERQRRGWSTTDLAERARVIAASHDDPIKLSQQLVSQFEQGTTKQIPRWHRYVLEAFEEADAALAPDADLQEIGAIAEDGALIRQLVEFTGHRPAQIARNIGVANTTINRHFAGTATTRLSGSTLEKLRTAYPRFPRFADSGFDDDASLDYVLVNILPSYAGMGGGGSGEGDTEQARLPRRLIVDELRGKPDDFELIDVRGDSMEPDFQHGDQILIDRRDRDPRQPGPFALHDGDGYVVKLVERVAQRRGWYRIFSANARYSPYEVEEGAITIMGRPVWFARRL